MRWRSFLRPYYLLLDLLFPEQCVSCGDNLAGSDFYALCDTCLEKIEIIGNSCCKFCGAAAGDFSKLKKGCAFCNPAKFHYTRAIGVVRYKPPARELIHDFKFHDNSRLSNFLASAMIERLASCGYPDNFDFVFPVPLHKKRQKTRGYNQSFLIARIIAEHFGVTCSDKILRRIRNTVAQSLLEPKERSDNIAGAFSVSADLGDKIILLVDDVMTTGSTVNECARVLREAGASRIYVIVWAR